MAKVAHVGHGYWGKNVARSLSRLDALAAVVDPMLPDIQVVADSYGVTALTFEQALANDSVDAISLATPAPMHFHQAKRALEAGKHVMVEKPITLDIAEAEALADFAESRGLVLMVGHLMQYHPAFVALRGLVESGELGKLQYCYSNRLSLGKLRTHEDVMWSFAPHDISMLLSLAGAPAKLMAQGHSTITPGIADVALLQLQFANDVRGHIQVSWLHPFKEQRLVVIGDRAMAVFEDSQPDWSKKLTVYRHQVSATQNGPVPVAGGAEPLVIEPGEPLLEECRHFVHCVDAGETPRTDGREAIAVLRVLQKATQALSANLATAEEES